MDLKGLLSWLEGLWVQSNQNLRDWLRQEIVDDDPYDTDTLFPNDQRQDADSLESQTEKPPK